MNRSYQTDLTEAEWEAIEPHLPAPKKRGRPRTHTPREILDADFYVLKSGCPWWRFLPRDLERPGRRSTGGSPDGERTAPSSGSTPPCASVYGPAWAGTRSLARASPIRKRPRLPRSAGSTGALSRQQEDQGPKAAPDRGHGGLGAQSPAVHSAEVPDQDGLRLLLESARTGLRASSTCGSARDTKAEAL
jgi:hypothetical protein